MILDSDVWEKHTKQRLARSVDDVGHTNKRTSVKGFSSSHLHKQQRKPYHLLVVSQMFGWRGGWWTGKTSRTP